MTERRSPWTGLTGSETLELQDELLHPSRRVMSEDDRARDIAAMYALRCVRALTGNDLRGALRAAQISHAATGLVRQGQSPPEVPREGQPVVDQDPAAGSRQRPRRIPAHPEHLAAITRSS